MVGLISLSAWVPWEGRDGREKGAEAKSRVHRDEGSRKLGGKALALKPWSRGRSEPGASEDRAGEPWATDSGSSDGLLSPFAQGSPGADGPPGRDGAAGVKVSIRMPLRAVGRDEGILSGARLGLSPLSVWKNHLSLPVWNVLL